ncbi:MAG: hypothetical protein IPN90_13350 [Elusimicrobia bacterium]|nr:hypothetical protein [Elusimicrobiota bacterium]
MAKSVTESWALDSGGNRIDDRRGMGYNTSETTVEYRYNGKGQMERAEGWTRGETSSGKLLTARRDGDGKIVGDAKEDGLREVGEVWGFDEWYSRNLYETRSVYGVRRGQAVVVKSETRSYAADDGGVRLGELEHGYNESWSTVWNRYSPLGQLEGAVGWTVGKSTVEVVKDTRVGDGLMAQRTESMTKNEYGVVMGQAVVMRSETQSWGAGSDGKRVSDSSAHGYTRSVRRVEKPV